MNEIKDYATMLQKFENGEITAEEWMAYCLGCMGDASDEG